VFSFQKFQKSFSKKYIFRIFVS